MEGVRKDRRILVAMEVDGHQVDGHQVEGHQVEGHQVEDRYGCRLIIARYGNCVIAG